MQNDHINKGARVYFIDSIIGENVKTFKVAILQFAAIAYVGVLFSCSVQAQAVHNRTFPFNFSDHMRFVANLLWAVGLAP